MHNQQKKISKSGIILLTWLVMAVLLPVMEASAQEGEPTFGEQTLPTAPLRNPEAFLHQFDSLVKKQNLPPEAAGLFQVALELMHTAATGKNPGAVREKSQDLLRSFEGLTTNQPLPPEVASLFNSFQQLMQAPPTTPTSP
jgi:hypothetical protein